MSGFRGFPPELFTFFAGLEKNNSKEYWAANKTTWENKVRQPMQVLLADLNGEFPPLRMFRPNRDVRFSKDKSPYKLWAGATSESRAVGGTGYYLRVQASGLVTGCGANGDGTRSTATIPRVARRRRQRSPIRGTDHRACRPITTGDLRRRTTTEGGAAGVPEEPSPRRIPALHQRSDGKPACSAGAGDHETGLPGRPGDHHSGHQRRRPS